MYFFSNILRLKSFVHTLLSVAQGLPRYFLLKTMEVTQLQFRHLSNFGGMFKMYSGKLSLHSHHTKQCKGEGKWKVQFGCQSIGQWYASIIVDFKFSGILTMAIYSSIAPLQPPEKLLSVLRYPNTISVSLFHEGKKYSQACVKYIFFHVKDCSTSKLSYQAISRIFLLDEKF